MQSIKLLQIRKGLRILEFSSYADDYSASLDCTFEEQPVPQDINTERYLTEYVAGEVSEGSILQCVV
jgi:hypothetical protein